MQQIQTACSNVLARQNHKLFTDVLETVGRYQRQLADESARIAGAIPLKELTDLDALYLNVLPDQKMSFVSRRDALRQLEAPLQMPLPAEKVGQEGRFLQELLASNVLQGTSEELRDGGWSVDAGLRPLLRGNLWHGGATLTQVALPEPASSDAPLLPPIRAVNRAPQVMAAGAPSTVARPTVQSSISRAKSK